jgi:hypothetical protein
MSATKKGTTTMDTSEIDTRTSTTTTKARCQNCDQEWDLDDLDAISHLFERVAPGEIMPAGQCPDPDCGAVCHLSTRSEPGTAA